MGNGSKLRLWCSAFACALAVLGADGYFVDITYVESAVAKGAGQSHHCCFSFPASRQSSLTYDSVNRSMSGREPPCVPSRPWLRLRVEQLVGSF